MKLLLIEANDVRRWIGARVGPELHVVPLALLGLASYARHQVPGLEVRVIESSLDAPTDEALTAILEEYRPDWVGLRSINFFHQEVRRIVQAVGAWRPIPVVVGGPIATALKEQLFSRVPELRLAVVGEGELPLVRLLQGLAPGTIPGVIVRSSEGIHATPAEAPIASLDSLPCPDYSLVDLNRYAKHLSYAYNQRRQGVLTTSRGCPYRCSFCFQLTDAPARLRSASKVFEDIEQLALRHDIRDFYFVDDVFNLSRARAMEVFQRLIDARLGVRLYFVNGLRTDRCDPAFIDKMIEAGTVWVTFGIESAHPRIAKLIRKRLDLTQAQQIISYTQSCGIAVNIDTMFGFPTETADEAKATLDWLGQLPHPSLLPYHFNLRGYAGCEIVEQAVEAGWDRDSFLATGDHSYNDMPQGSPTFSRHQMLSHLVDYHGRFGLSNRQHLRWSVGVLQRIGYRDDEIVDLYSVLMNRRLGAVQELLGD